MKIDDIKHLLFKAEKITDNAKNPNRYSVKGYPFKEEQFVNYKEYKNDFIFVTYQEVIAAGIWRCSNFFGKKIADLKVTKQNFGRAIQWFSLELTTNDNIIVIDGDNYYMFLNISYSYDVVNVVNYDIGIYRSKCSNGMIFGYKSIEAIKVKPANIFALDNFFNPCLYSHLQTEYQRNITVLKQTTITPKDALEIVSKFFGSKSNLSRIDNEANDLEQKAIFFDNTIDHSTQNITQRVLNKYIDEMGTNGYAVLNSITDLSSKYKNEEHKITDDISNYTLSKQRQAGIWLDTFISFIETSNGINHNIDFNNLQSIGSKKTSSEYKFDLDSYINFLNKKV